MECGPHEATLWGRHRGPRVAPRRVPWESRSPLPGHAAWSAATDGTFASPQHLYVEPNPEGDGIWRWGRWEVLAVRVEPS